MNRQALITCTALAVILSILLFLRNNYWLLPTPISSPARLRLHWFAFGDSYSATGFDIDSAQPSPSNPMGNAAPGLGTQSGGDNWVGYLTTQLNSSLILSYNLAIAGATIDNALATWGFGDMTSQVAAFQSHYTSRPETVRWTADNTIASFWVGINDVYYGFTHDEDPSIFALALMDRYRPLVEQIYFEGVRKFLILNCPPSTRSPQVHEENDLPEQFERHAAMVSAYNDALIDMAFRFSQDHEDATVVFYDSWAFMTHVLDNPAEYGYQDSTCINDDGSSCVWWNNLHPGWMYHKSQAEDMLASIEPLGW